MILITNLYKQPGKKKPDQGRGFFCKSLSKSSNENQSKPVLTSASQVIKKINNFFRFGKISSFNYHAVRLKVLTCVRVTNLSRFIQFYVPKLLSGAL